MQLELSAITTNLKANSRSKLQLYNQAKALDREIHIFEEREPILQYKVESSVQGLTKVELSWAECTSMMALAEKKAVDTAVALVVTDIITTLDSLE